MKNLTIPKSNVFNADNLVEQVAKQYKNQGLSLSELIEIGNRGLKKAKTRTEDLEQTILFIRNEIVTEVEKKRLTKAKDAKKQ